MNGADNYTELIRAPCNYTAFILLTRELTNLIGIWTVTKNYKLCCGMQKIYYQIIYRRSWSLHGSGLKGGNRLKLKVLNEIWDEYFQKAYRICDQMTQK